MATDRFAGPAAGRVRLISADLDGTLLGDPASTARFTEAWKALPPRARPTLVYNTGRSVLDTRGLVEARALPEPDYIVGAVGTELHDASGELDEGFAVRFGPEWDREVVDRIVAATPGVTPQPATFQNPFKSSWFWARARPTEILELQARLESAGVRAHVDYSCRYFLDFVPANGGKGQALLWLCARLRIQLRDVLVAGDTGNDSSMFLLPGVRGIVVQNALPELHALVVRRGAFVAQGTMADGVVEGLRHFGVLPERGEQASLDVGLGSALV